MVMTTRKESDFTQPVEADFIVALKSRAGTYSIFVEGFLRKNGKSYMRHTVNLQGAKRFSKFAAFDALKGLDEYRVAGRVERVAPDGETREVVEEITGK